MRINWNNNENDKEQQELGICGKDKRSDESINQENAKDMY